MSEPVFDPNKPYGTVTGLPGVAFQQNGHSFNGRHEYVDPEAEAAMSRPSRQEILTEKEARKEALKEAFKEQLAKGGSVTVINPPVPRVTPEAVAADPITIGAVKEAEKPVDFGSVHWTKLRKMVEDAGGTYVGKTEAVEFLEARGG